MTEPTLRNRFHHILRTLVSERPAIYLPFARRKYPGPSPEVIGPETEFVIDGYTRSASTFAVYAFQTVQSTPVRMAHHLHAPAQLIAAARAGLPALVVIRDPEGALLSQVIREPGVTIRDALFSYARFYERLQPYRSRYVVADFEEVTSDFGAVIRRVNDRFGTSYAVFEHTDENLERCMNLMRKRPTHSAIVLGFESGTVTLDEVLRADIRPDPARREVEDAWVPSPDRKQVKSELAERWADPRLDAARRRAYQAYHTFLQQPKTDGETATAAAASPA